MPRLRIVALASLLVLASAEACDLNPQPLPPIDNQGTDDPTDGPSAPPMTTADAGTSNGSKDSGPAAENDGGNDAPDGGDADAGDADAGDADADDAGNDGSVSDDDAG